MAQEKPVALWAVPRSISTAFERAFVERDDFEVFHEPFGDSYYYSEERLSNRYPDVEPKAKHNYKNVLARILEPREKRVFVKDMAYHAKGLMGKASARTPGLLRFLTICSAFTSEPPRTRTWNLEIKSLCRWVSGCCW